MNAPSQAVAGLVWALVGPPVVVFAATRARGHPALHASLMIACVVIELAVFTAFMFLMTPGPRRSACSY